ncbi:MAG: RecX family transcriptional regulator [Dehalococcoidia bacterium]
MPATASTSGPASAEAAAQRLHAVRRALQLTARRRRTEHELREALGGEFADQEVEHAVTRLRDLEYINDTAWAVDYVARDRSSRLSASVLRRELLGHGVAAEVAAAALDGYDDVAAAFRAAERRLPSLRRLSAKRRAVRLTGHLQRRGFGWSTVHAVFAGIAASAEIDIGHVTAD